MVNRHIHVNRLQDVVALLDAMTLKMQLISVAGKCLVLDGHGIESKERVLQRKEQRECAEIVLALADEWRRLYQSHCPDHQREMNESIGGTIEELENSMVGILRTIKAED